MKKYFFMFLSACFTLFLLIGMNFFLVKAEKNRVIFFNRETEGVGLYITKNVVYPSNDMKVPESNAFFFQLKLNGGCVREQRYRLFDSAGKEVFNYNGTLTTEYNKNQLLIPFVTDYNGRFSIKDGETACFENFRAGSSYEITEEPCKDYIQIEPSGNRSATGILLPEGNVEVFRNKYTPVLSDDKQEVMMEISKEIVFPKGYFPPESPEFCFNIEINGKPWANETYAVYNQNSREKVSTGLTDAQGRFFMKGGYTAQFHAIPRDSDYLVSEENRTGWVALSSNVIKGAVRNQVTSLVFSNTEAAFAVSKEMTEEIITDDFFRFQLTTDGNPWIGANYYLYSTTGKQIDSKVYSTDVDGMFSLRAGQTAVFVGIPFQTRFSVSEMSDRYYLQMFPPDEMGYENRIVSENLEVLSFRNQVNTNAVQPVMLSLLKKDENHSLIEGAVFQIFRDAEFRDEVKRTVTGQDGIADFGMIEPGVYYINEMSSSAGYSLLPNMIKIEIEKDGMRINNVFYKYSRKYPNVVFETLKDGVKACITVYNYKNFKLPFTGGDGAGYWIFIGLAGNFLLCIWMKRRLDKTGEIS